MSRPFGTVRLPELVNALQIVLGRRADEGERHRAKRHVEQPAPFG
jgi:hypothetical protein